MATKKTSGLTTLTPAAGSVKKFGETEVSLRPTTTAEYLILVRRFPILQSIIMGGDIEITDDMTDEQLREAEAKSSRLVFKMIVAEAPEALAAWIAVSAGHKGDLEVEAGVLTLVDEIFFALADEVRQLTMPHGSQVFFQGLQNMASILGSMPTPTEQTDGESPVLAPLAA